MDLLTYSDNVVDYYKCYRKELSLCPGKYKANPPQEHVHGPLSHTELTLLEVKREVFKFIEVNPRMACDERLGELLEEFEVPTRYHGQLVIDFAHTNKRKFTVAGLHWN